MDNIQTKENQQTKPDHKQTCPWAKNHECHATKCIRTSCDLYNLPYTQEDIAERIQKEQDWLQNHPKAEHKTRLDKIKGLILLTEAIHKIQGKPLPQGRMKSLWHTRKLARQILKPKP